eukprot:scaffold103118_cov46-Prasinocladus_malaysianus.AAC.1
MTTSRTCPPSTYMALKTSSSHLKSWFSETTMPPTAAVASMTAASSVTKVFCVLALCKLFKRLMRRLTWAMP